MKKNVAKNIAGLGLSALLSVLPIKQITAQEVGKDSIVVEPEKTGYLASSMEYHLQSDSPNKGRINMFYNLPLKTQVYSFIELYDEDGYFLKNMFYTPLIKGLGSKVETKHCGAFNDKAGVGLEYCAKLPGGIVSSVKALPLWVDKEGLVSNDFVLGYFLAKDFHVSKNVDLCLSSFGEVNADSKGGPSWSYGESDLTAKLKTNVGQFDLGVGFNHICSGDLLPDNVFRVRLGYHPKK